MPETAARPRPRPVNFVVKHSVALLSRGAAGSRTYKAGHAATLCKVQAAPFPQIFGGGLPQVFDQQQPSFALLRNLQQLFQRALLHVVHSGAGQSIQSHAAGVAGALYKSLCGQRVEGRSHCGLSVSEEQRNPFRAGETCSVLINKCHHVPFGEISDPQAIQMFHHRLCGSVLQQPIISEAPVARPPAVRDGPVRLYLPQSTTNPAGSGRPAGAICSAGVPT